MKNLIYRFLLIILISITFQNSLKGDNQPSNQDILFEKKNPTGPQRTPPLYPVSFSGILFMDEIAISTQNYSDKITVEITGINGYIIQTMQISESCNALIDVSSLPEGDYSIKISTQGKGIFTGEFEVITF